MLTRETPASQIVLVGRSLGSGPTLHLASQESLTLPPGIKNVCQPCGNKRLACSKHSPGSCAGVIVQSGLESGARVAFNKCISFACFPLDIMRNYRAMPRITVPVGIMHGTHDEVVPVENGKNLYKLCRRPGARSFGWPHVHAKARAIPSLAAITQ